MTYIGNGVNSAFYAGQYGLQNASNGITQASSSIAQRTVESAQNVPSSQANEPQNVISADQAASSSSSNTDLTSDLISLNVNSLNAQASAKVLEVANDTLGTIIDTLA